VTTLKAVHESPFKSDSTASNRAGVTLMNNQVGAVVAEVMRGKENVTVTPLPSMIRVDAVGRMDFIYDDISEALGEEPGYFDLDDRTIMFANPEDAAEYIGFDLSAV
jgi:propane monooxygenase coupling protein